MYAMLDLLIVACGIYVLYSYYQMKTKGIVKEGLLLPKGLSIKRCRDKDAYIAEMGPKLLMYGISMLLCGIVGMLESMYQMLGLGYLIVLAVFLGVTIWFARQTKKAIAEYFQ